MTAFMITFGSRWAHKVHPAFPAAHPEGWVTVLARDSEQARLVAVESLAGEYSFIWPEIDFRPAQFPRGELGVIDALKPARPEWSTVTTAATINDAVSRLREADNTASLGRVLESLGMLLSAIVPTLPNPAIEDQALQLSADVLALTGNESIHLHRLDALTVPTRKATS